MLRTSVNCPYCGHENPVVADPTKTYAKSVETCDNETGGCDRDFAVYTTVGAQSRAVGLVGIGDDSDAQADRRLFFVKTRQADDPESDSSETLTVRELLERSGALWSLAATMKDGDSLRFVSTDALTSFDIRCEDSPAPVRAAEIIARTGLDSLDDARQAARDDARISGTAQIVFETPGGFAVAPAVGFTPPVEWRERERIAAARVNVATEADAD